MHQIYSETKISNILKSSKGTVLAVDLDGSLLKTDAFWECFWARFSQNPWLIFTFFWIFVSRGRAPAKHYLSESLDLDRLVLPFNSDVIALCQLWKKHGGEVCLATAASEKVALYAAQKFPFIGRVYSSSKTLNLKGAKKAKKLSEEHGESGYAYIGDHMSDLAVWKNAKYGFAVRPSRRLRKEIKKLDIEFDFLNEKDSRVRALLRATRPHQWVKNILVFIPMLAAHEFTEKTLTFSSYAFVSFCLVASSIYLLNDLLDLKHDRLHPRKKIRPLASGDASLLSASSLILILFFVGLILGGQVSSNFMLILAVYAFCTVLYSIVLKQIILLDIFALATLYILRLIGGGEASGVGVSSWLIVFSGFFFLSLAAVKRMAEIQDYSQRNLSAISGRAYRVIDGHLVSVMAITSGFASSVILALYFNTNVVQDLYERPKILLIMCFVVIYWISYLISQTSRGVMTDDPIVFALKDQVSYCCLCAILLILAASLM